MKTTTNVVVQEKKFVPFQVDLTVESEQEVVLPLVVLNAPSSIAGFEASGSFHAIAHALRKQGIERDSNKFWTKNRSLFKHIEKVGA